ncbi:MAG: sulfite exporter TauE/SafE family protein [Eubacteriales bacterium]
MNIILIITGTAFGIIGGMGMGGGVILIPVLTLLLSFSQHGAQALNLAIFFPMAVAAIVLHFKHKLIRLRSAVKLIIGGLPGAALGAYLAILLDERTLRTVFGTFLLLVAAYRIYIMEIKDKKSKKL